MNVMTVRVLFGVHRNCPLKRRFESFSIILATMKLQKLDEGETNWGLPIPPRFAPIIFSKVPISNLPALRLVSKSWNRLVLDYAPTSTRRAIIFSTRDFYRGRDPVFLNPKIHCFDIDSLSFVASSAIIGPLTEFTTIYSVCNGLLFIENGGTEIGRQYEGIFNPMTHEFFPTPMDEEFLLRYYHGFGFSPNTKEYKLFRVLDCGGGEMSVLRFGSKPHEWTLVFLSAPIDFRSHGCYMDGVIYWVASQKQNQYIIYAMDVETEIFNPIFMFNVDHGSYVPSLQLFDGTIYAIVTEPTRTRGWRMQNKHTWIADFLIYGYPKEVSPIKASDDGKIFFKTIGDLSWFDKCAEKVEAKNKIRRLIPNNREFLCLCVPLIESIHFGSLSNILAGDD